MSVRAAAFALALLALGIACHPDAGGEAAGTFRPLDIGAVVPAYAARTLAGDTVHIAAGESVTLVNIWATWCASCREEMAALDSLQREFGPTGLRVVGVSADNGDGARVRRFAESERLAFTVAHDPAGDIQRDYQAVGVPATYLVGRDGTLLWRWTGNLTPVMSEVRTAIRRALSSDHS